LATADKGTFTPSILSHFGLHIYSYKVLVVNKNIEHTILPTRLLKPMHVKHTILYLYNKPSF